jgi:hypothetical protein
MDFDGLGKLLIVGGVVLLVMGVVFVIAGRSGLLGGFLQAGTLTFSGNNVTCVVPIIASIVLSIVLTIVLNVLIRFLNK